MKLDKILLIIMVISLKSVILKMRLKRKIEQIFKYEKRKYF